MKRGKKLKKFDKNLNQKKKIIGLLVGIILLIGSVVFYKTFALYEEKKEFNILKGIVPNFSKSDVEIAMTLNGEFIKEIPKKSNFLKVNVDCGSTATGSWDHENWSIIVSDFKSTSIKCNLSFVDNRGILKKREENIDFWQYKENITKVVFEPSFSAKKNASFVFDVEETGSKSVKSYLVPNEDDKTKYILFIQSDGGIKANLDSSSLFNQFHNLESIEGLEYFDTSEVVYMNWMFSECSQLTSLDLSTFDTSNVEDFSWMFRFASKITDLNVSSFNTKNAQDMSGMFKGISVSSLNLSSFDTSNVKKMYQMFFNMEKLTQLDIRHFNTEQVLVMGGMFSGNVNLKKLDISNFEFIKVLESNSSSSLAPRSDLFKNMPDDAQVYIKNEEVKNWILNAKGDNIYPLTWTEANFIIQG